MRTGQILCALAEVRPNRVQMECYVPTALVKGTIVPCGERLGAWLVVEVENPATRTAVALDEHVAQAIRPHQITSASTKTTPPSRPLRACDVALRKEESMLHRTAALRA